MNRINSLLGVLAFSLLFLTLPTIASAQWGGNNRRDNDCNDDYYGRNVGYNNYGLRDTVRRLKRDTKDFVNFIDNALDRSIYDDTDYEDRINDLAKNLRSAADRLESRYDSRDIYRSQREAQDVVNAANRLDRELRRARLGYDVDNYWNNLQRQINEISNAYRSNRGRGIGSWRDIFRF